MLLPELVLQDDRSHLTHLVHFRISPVPLQGDTFLNPRAREDVVAAPRPFGKSW